MNAHRSPFLGLLLAVTSLLACGDSESATEPDPSDPASLSLLTTLKTIERGTTFTIEATVRDADGNVLSDVALTWSSSDESVATVRDGVVEGVSLGSATIEARAGSLSRRATITVVRPTVTTLQLTGAGNVAVGRTTLLSIAARDARGDAVPEAESDVTWTTTPAELASVSATGVLRGLAAGTVRAIAGVDGVADTLVVEIAPAPPGLSPADSAHMIEAMAAHAEEAVWPLPPAIQEAQRILWDPDYDVEQWTSFFRGQLLTQRWNQNLWGWFVYPVFYWGPQERHTVLQAALRDVFFEEIDRVFRSHGEGLGASMAGDPTLHEHLLIMNQFLDAWARDGRDDDRHAWIAEHYVGLISANPRYLGKTRLAGPDLWVGIFRLHTWLRLLEALRRSDETVDVAALLGLSGQHRTLYERFDAVLVDNLGLADDQVDAVMSLLEGIPKPILQMSAISVRDFWGDERFRSGPRSLDGSVNVFGIPLGAVGRPFPSDVDARESDTFIEVVAHELTHVIDAVAVTGNPDWAATRAALIARAGEEPENYLRSMIPRGFFVDAPQEFMASIANQWFTDSEHVIRLGHARFDRGVQEPIQQALFFADVMSVGGDESAFFRHSTGQRATSHAVPAGRNHDGFIVRLDLTDSIYEFERDDDGMVTAITVTPR